MWFAYMILRHILSIDNELCENSNLIDKEWIKAIFF